jgi:hypothetical protein
MTAKQGLNIELGARRVAGAAKAPEKTAAQADASDFRIRAYIYFTVRVKRDLWKTRGGVKRDPSFALLSQDEHPDWMLVLSCE